MGLFGFGKRKASKAEPARQKPRAFVNVSRWQYGEPEHSVAVAGDFAKTLTVHHW